MTSQCVNNKKYDTRWSRVAWLLFFTCCDVFFHLLQYTRMEKCNYSFYTIKIEKVYWKIFGVCKTKNKSTDVIWRGIDAICVSPLIDHGQQPMKIHKELTEVTLLYKSMLTDITLHCKTLSYVVRHYTTL